MHSTEMLPEAGLSRGSSFYQKNMGHGRVGDGNCHLEGDMMRRGVVDRSVVLFFSADN